MKNYYFVGGQSAAIAEVMVILREKGVPFVRLQPDKYGICSLDNEEVDRVIAQGFFPVVIGVATARKDLSCWKAIVLVFLLLRCSKLL